MLSTWNANVEVENINHAGPAQRGRGRGKSFKALGDAGLGSSENPPPASGKGMLQQQQQRKLKPLGSYSENAPPSAAAAKGKAGGLGLQPGSSSKPQQKQRRALGDISNAGKGLAGAAGAGNGSQKLSGKQLTPGLKFVVHSDSGKAGGAPQKARAPSAASSKPTTKAAAAVKGRSMVRPDGQVEDVELALGRMGDEEEALVERREEQRAARALKHATSSAFFGGPSKRSSSRSRSTSSASPRASFSSNPSSSSRVKAKPQFGRDITNISANSNSVTGTGTAANKGKGGIASSCGGGAFSVLDKSLDSAIDRMTFNDLQDGNMGLASGNKKKSGHELLEDDDDDDAFSLTMALEGSSLGATPLGLVDDAVDDAYDFLTQEVDLNFV